MKKLLLMVLVVSVIAGCSDRVWYGDKTEKTQKTILLLGGELDRIQVKLEELEKSTNKLAMSMKRDSKVNIKANENDAVLLPQRKRIIIENGVVCYDFAKQNMVVCKPDYPIIFNGDPKQRHD